MKAAQRPTEFCTRPFPSEHLGITLSAGADNLSLDQEGFEGADESPVSQRTLLSSDLLLS